LKSGFPIPDLAGNYPDNQSFNKAAIILLIN
jgi:hypothetical protein